MSSHSATFKSCSGNLKSGSRSFSGIFAAMLALVMAAVATPASFASGATTATTLVLSSGTVTSGTVVTLTATVTTGVSTAVSPGLVTFCDATAAHCLNSAVLGTAQLTSSGTAVLRFVPAIGNHTYAAVFHGTNLYATSTSLSQALTVSGTYATGTTLTSTGAVGNYTLAASVAAKGGFGISPTAMVSFQDTSNGNYAFGTAPLGAAVATQTFAAAAFTGTVTTPQGAAVGDFNGDGILDIAVAAGTNSVNIFLGNGNGTFTAGTTLTAQTTPTGIAVGDFNNDGLADLAVTNFGSNTVSIFLGKAGGGFQAQATYSTGTAINPTTGPTAIAVGDFNNDGNADLAIANQTTNSVTILLNNGSGTFTAALTSPVAVGTTPSGVIVSDFNADGNADLAVTNSGANSVSILEGNGIGGFTQPSGSPFGAGTSPKGLVAGDFNGDGRIDVAITSSGDNTVSILIGSSTKTFTTAVAYAAGTNPSSIALGDFNGDGIADLAVVDPTDPNKKTQSVLLGNGDGTFGAASSFSVGSTGSATLAADFNGDGFPDLATPTQANNSVTILLDQITHTAKATLNTPNVPQGAATTHKVDAVYPGETFFTTSTSSTISLTGTPIPTLTLLGTNPSSSSYTQQVVLSATLSPYSLGTYSTNTELITFMNGATVLGTGTLSSGVATLNITSLPVGTDSLTARYLDTNPTDANFVASTSAAVNYSVAKATPVITWPTPTAISYGTLLSPLQQNATATVAGTFTYSPASYTLLTVGTYTLNVTFTPNAANSGNYTTATSSVTLTVNPANPQISWASPASITYPTQLSSIQLNATVAVYTMVPLTSFYNVSGIYTDGSTYSTGGFDGAGSAYSANTLGTSVTWNNITYPLGPANAPDAVSNTTISLPAGHYANLTMLGALVNNATPANTFVVNYTDGTTASVTQSFSDWVYPLNYTGETEVKCVPYRNVSNGNEDSHLTCVYGYQIPLDSTKIPLSITMPATRNIVMLAMALVSPPIPGVLGYTPPSGTVLPTGENTLTANFTPTDQADYTSATASVMELVNPANQTNIVWANPASIPYGTALSATQLNAVAQTNPGTTSVSLSSYYRVNAFQSDGSTFATGGFDNAGNAYSSNKVGSSVTWNGQTYSLGPANLPSAVTSTIIALPQGSFASLTMIGAATTTGQTAQSFTITYTDGTTAITTVSLSSWTQSAGYTGETTVSTTPYRNNSGGGQTTGNVNLYGYSIPLDNTKTVQSITLPNNRNVVIVAMALNTSSTPTTIPGSYTYTPPAGTVLPVGTNSLSVQFTPTNTNYASATKTVSIVVTKQTLLFTANNETAVYGTTVPAYTYTVTGYVNGDTSSNAFTGTPTLTTNPASPTTVNNYTITAAIGSLASSNYNLTFATGTLSITKATPVITWATPADISYGTALSTSQLNASSSVGGTFSYSPAATTILSAGPHTLTVTFTPTDTTDYTTASSSVQLVVDQRALTVTATNQTVVYGNAPTAYTYTVTGFATGDTQANSTTGAPALSSTATASSTVGSYPITTAIGSLASSNYSFTLVNGTVTVTKSSAYTITWKNQTVTYGAATIGSGSLIATSSIPGSFSYNPAAGTVLPASSTPVSVVATFNPSDATDYAGQAATAQITVNPAVLTVAADNFSRPYNTANPTFTATLSGFVNSDTQASAVTGSAALSTTATTTSPVGAYPITSAAGTLAAKNYTFTYTNGTLTVTQAPATAYTITWKNQTVTYGAATIGSGSLIATSTIPGSFSYNPAAGTVLPASSTPVSVVATFTPSDATDYAGQAATAQITVTPAVLTVTANNFSRPYNTANPTFTATISGFVNSDTQASAVTGSAALSTTATTTSPVGAYPITSAAGTLTAKNYTFTYTNGTLTVTQAPATAYTITWKNQTVTYGAATIGSGSLIATSSIPGSFSYNPVAGTVLPASSTPVSVVATFTPTDSTDYAGQAATAQITVNPAVLTVTANNFSRPYNTANPTFTATISGFVNSDTQASAVTGSAALSTTATTTSPVGAYPITSAAGTLTAKNYTFTYTNGTLTVTQAPATAYTITWKNQTVTYGAATIGSGSLIATSTIPGSFSYNPAAGTVLPASSTPVSVVATFTPSDATDYAGQAATAQITVTPAVLTVTADNFSRPYNTANPTFTATISGFVNSDTQASAVTGSAALSTTATTTSPVGAYPITSAAGTLTAKNYTFTYTNGTLTVTQAPASAYTITWKNQTVTYGAATIGSGSLIATSSIPGSFSYNPAAGTVLPASSTPVSVVATFTPSDATDYAGQAATAQITVNPAVLTVTADNFSRPYNTANPTFTATLSGFVNSDTQASAVTGSAALSTTATTTSPVGAYPITSAAGTLAAKNYTFTYANGTLTVTQAPATAYTITWKNQTVTYGAATIGSGSLIATSTIPGSFSYNPAAGTVLPASSTPVSVVATFTPQDSTDYAGQAATAQITVNPAVLTVTADNFSRPYNTANPTFTATISGFVNSDTQASAVTGSAALSTTATTTSPVGAYPITSAAGTLTAKNYTFTYTNGTLTVTQAPASAYTITWKNQTVTYGAATIGSGSLIATSSIPGSFSYNPVAGTVLPASSTPVSVVATFTPTDSTDYAGQAATAQITVNPAVLTVTANNFSRPYNTANPTFTATISGFVNSDTQASAVTGSAALSTTATTTSPVGAYPITSAAGTLAAKNYTFTYTNGTLTITQATGSAYTITWKSQSAVYGTALGSSTLQATSSIPGSFSYNPSGVLQVGSAVPVTATFTPTDTTDYASQAATAQITITPATLTVTAANASRAYGAADPTFTDSITGYVNGDTSSVVTGAASLSSTDTPTSQAGTTYPITATTGTLAAKNYTFTFVPGTLSITQATGSAYTITWKSQSAVYGTALGSSTLQATSSIPGSFAYNPSGVLQVGPAVAVTATFTPTDTTDYASQAATAQITITPATLTVTAANASRAYGAADPTFTDSITGYVNGDTSAVVTGAASISSTDTPTSQAGTTYPITATTGTLAAKNYTFTFVAGTLSITQATGSAYTITWKSQSAVYGTALGSSTLQATSSIPGSFAYNPSGVLQVGPAVAVTATFTPTDTTDYASQAATAQITITPATLTVTAANASRAYGAADPTFTDSITGYVNGDTSSVVTGAASLSSTDTPTSQAGTTYPITATTGTLAAKNYTFTFVAGTLSITQATGSAYTITWKSQSAVYGTVLGSTSLQATSSIPGSFAYNPSGVLQVGPAVAVTATFTPTDTTDYASQAATAQITITPAVLTVTAANASRAYGAADPTFTDSITGYVNGDTSAVVTGAASISSTDTPTSQAGTTYPITATTGTLAAKNYTFTFVAGTLSITQATGSAYTITWKNQSAVYGTALGSSTLQATSSIPGSFAYNPSGVLQVGPAVAVTATFTPTDTTDYASQAATAQITITPATLTVTAANASRAYGAADPTFTDSITGYVNGDTSAVVTGAASISSTDTPTSQAGTTYPITATTGTLAAKNYTFTFVAGTLSITQATGSAYTITWKSQSAVYGTALGSSTLQATSSIPGSFAYNPSGVLQVGPAVAVTATFTPTDTTDYASQAATAQITITPATLTVTAANASRAYGAADPAFTDSITGYVNGDTSAVVTGAASISSTDTPTSQAGTTYPITATTGTLAAKNYTFTFVPGTLSITQATGSAYTITWKSQSAVYGTALGSSTLQATSSIPGSFSYNPSGVLQVGSAVPVTATFTPTDTTDYASQAATAQITITPAVLTVTAANASRAYGAADPAFTDSITGYVNGDTSSVVTGAASLSSTDTPTSQAGTTYPITATTGTLAAKNYTFTFVAGTLSITQATGSAYTITWKSQSAVYGTALGSTSLQATSSIPGSFAYNPSGVLQVGSAVPVTATFTPTDTTDYASQAATAQITITPATLTVTAANASRAYGAADPTFTDSIAGYVNGDTSSVVTGSASISSTDTPTSQAGTTYPITATTGTLAAKNYTFTFVAGTLSITQATGSAYTITWKSQSAVYGTALGSSTLQATSSIPGSFSYNPSGVLQVGPAVAVTATFTPTDTTDYASQAATAQITITPATLTVTAANATRAYGAADPTFTDSITGYVNGDTSSVVTGSASISSTDTPTSQAGTTYPITATTGTLAAKNYTFTFVAGTLSITQATGSAYTITWKSQSAVYGTALGSTSLQATSSIPGSFSYNPSGVLQVGPAVAVTATFTPTDTTDYASQAATAQITITPATLTVTAANASRAYGAADPVFTDSIAGYVNGDTSSVVTGAASISSTDTPTSQAGTTYPITATTGTLAAKNYTFTFVAGTLSITQATGSAYTITWKSQSAVYGTALGSTSLQATSSIPGSFSYNPSGVLQVGPAVAVTATFTPTDTTDYASQAATAQITITPATLTVTAANASRAYGAADPTFTDSITGYVNNDTSAVVTGSASITSTDTPTSQAGTTYPITATTGTLAAKNYTFTFVAGTLSITQATGSAYTITWKSQSAVYGTALGSSTLQATSSIPGSFSYNPSGVLQVGSAVPVTATFTPTDTTDYASQAATAQITITPATLTVTANNASRAYGAADPTFTDSITGYVNGDTSAVVTGAASISSTDTPTSQAGTTYPITATTGTLAAKNYTFTFVPGTLSITQATGSAYTITWKSQSAVYGTALGSTSLQATSSIPGSFSYNPSGVLQVGSAVPVTATFTPTDTTDYASQAATAQITITPATLTVTANNASRAYGAADPTFTDSITGYVNGDTSAVVTGAASISSTDTPTSQAGTTYPITATTGTLAAKNYTFTFVPGTLSITQATGSAYTITWKSQSAVYGTALGSTSLQATSSIPGSFSYNPSGVLQVGSAVPVTATFTPTDTTDYASQAATAQITITPATLTVTAANASRAYGAADPTFTDSITGYVNNDTSAVVTGSASITSTDTPTSQAGTTYPITATTGTLAAKNYTFTFVAGTLSITQATGSAYTITWKSQSAVYGTALGSSTLQATSSIPGSFSYSPSGVLQVGPAVAVTATFTPTDTTDYASQAATAQITITPATLTVTAANASRAYGAADPTFTDSITGYVNGDTSAVVTGAASISSTDTPTSQAGTTYPITATTGTLAAKNYTFTFVAGTLSITQATGSAYTITWKSQSAVYGTALGSSTLQATSSIPGSFAYNPSGVLQVGPAVAVTATFTPTDTTDYASQAATAQITITPATLTVTAANASRAYGAADPTFTDSITGYVNGDTSSVVTGAASISSTDTPTSQAGTTYPITATTGTLAAKNYTFTFVAGTLSITQATGSAYTITWKNQSAVYGTALGSTSLQATSSIPGSFAYNPSGVLQVGPAVAVTATFTPTDTTDYASQAATAQITITPAVLTVTAANASRAYGAADPTFTDSITGYVNGDTSAVVTGAASISSTDTPTSQAGTTYPITATTGTLAAKNYTFTFVAGTLSITQATGSAYTITWKSQSAVYGTALGSSTLQATSSIPGSFAYNPSGVLQVGPAVAVTATFTPTDTTDYASQAATAQITITPATLTVTAANASRAYGAADPTFTDSITGYVNGDTSSVVTGSASISSTDTPTSQAGTTYPITATTGTLAAKNYTFTFVAGTLSITQATGSAYTITWKSQSAVYGTALGSSTLQATSSIPGSFAYNPSGVLQVGPAVAVTATFTPTDTTDYASQAATAQITITPATLTVTAANASRAYGAADPTFTDSIAGYVNGDTSSVVTGAASLSSTDTPTSQAGTTYPITATTGTLAAKNYTFTFVAGTLSITQATGSAYTITWKSQSAVYGTALGSSTLQATSSIPGSFAYNPSGVLQVGPAVAVTATFTPTDTTDYASQAATAQITITPATLTVTAANASRAYGAADPTFTDSITGYVNGDTSAVVTGAASISSTDTPTSQAGTTYPITATTGTLAAKNYTFTFVAGTLSITQATETITWTSTSVTYGNSTIGAGTLIATSSVQGSFSYSPAAGTVLSVGSTPVTATFTPTDTKDYSTQTASATITVTPAPLTVTANNFSRAYNTTNPTFTGSVTGAVNNDTFTESFSTTAITASPAGSYPIIPTIAGANLTNYTVTTTDGTLTVTQANANINWPSTSVTYGASTIGSGTLVATSSIQGAFTYSPAAGTVLSVGSTPVTATFTPTDTKNYSTQSVIATITVTPATLTLTANNATRAYNTPNPSFTGSISGAVNGDTFTESFSTTATTSSTAGAYPITPSAAGTNLSNYTLAVTPGTLTITQATATINWPSTTVSYGNSTVAAGSLIATSSVPGSFTYSPAAGTVLNVGSNSVSATFTPTDTKDYSTQTVTATITVTPATLTVTAGSATRAYGTANPAFMATATGAVNGDTFTFSESTIATISSPVGNYSIVPTAAGTNINDYTVVYVNGTLTINQATLTVTAGDATRTYGAANPAFSASATGAVNGDTFTFTESTTATASSPVGNYGIVPVASGSNLSNYKVVYNNGNLSVTQATLTVTAANANRTYGAANPTFSASATGAVNGDTFTLTESTPATPSSPVGNYPIVPTASGTNLADYNVVYVNGTLTVGQATLTVTAADANRTYGASNPTFSASAVGAVNGDTFTFTESTTATASSPIGNYAIIPVASGSNISDYNVTYVNGTLTVGQATLTVTANSATRSYNTPNPTFSASATGAVNGDMFTYTESTTATTSSPVGNYAIVPVATGSNLSDYMTVYNNGTLTIAQANPVITWTAPTIVIYGTALSNTQLDATATIAGVSIPGSLVYTPAAGTIPTAGTDTLTVTFTPTDSTDYTSVTKSLPLTVAQATPIINWPAPANMVYGTPLGSSQLDATANLPDGTSIPGSFAYSPAAGTYLSVGHQDLSVTFIPTDTTDFTGVTKTISIFVTQATLTISANNFTRLYGTVNPPFTGTVTGAQDGNTFVESFSNSAVTLSQVGQYPIVPSVTGTNLADYTQVVQNGTLSITQAPALTTLTLSTTSIAYDLPVTFTANVASTTSGTPTGTVNFFDNGSLLNSANVTNGVATYSTTSLPVGTQTITAIYSGDINFSSSTASAASGSNTITILPLDFTFKLTSQATVEGTYGTTRQYTFHIAPIGGTYPGTVQLSASPTGPILATYTFSPAEIDKLAGPTDITLTVATRKLASLESPQDRSSRLSHIAFGLFLLPLLGLRYSRRSSRKLTRLIIHSLLILSSLGAIGTLTGCGAGYFDRTYPITVTAVSNGIQHSVAVDFHIDQSPQ